MRDNVLTKFFQRLENSLIFYSIRTGLAKTIPVVIIGSFTQLLMTLNGHMLDLYSNRFFTYMSSLLSLLYTATIGLLSIYILIFISLSYIEKCRDDVVYPLGACIASLSGFIILNGGLNANFNYWYLGVGGTFTAILSALLASALYRRLSKTFNKKYRFPNGLDINTGNFLSCLLPLVCVFLFFSFISLLLEQIFHQPVILEIFRSLFDKFFLGITNPFLRGLCFVLLTDLLWMFGLHGGNILGDVQLKYFSASMNINLINLQNGVSASRIMTDCFFNTFVFIGGCGALISLLLIIFIAGKRRNNRTLAKMASFPMIFNINELLVFAFPTVFNPYMFIPFIITPVVLVFTSYFAMYFGWVPITTARVSWNIPIFINGYMATGSIAGSILQLVNIIIGMLIYLPFFKLYEKAQHQLSKSQIVNLTSYVKQCEESNTPYHLMSDSCAHSAIAKQLSNDLRISLKKREINIYYQPQFNQKNECIGAESLLRWFHPVYGLIYPPLIIKIAEECNLLYSLETYIFDTVARDQKNFEFDNLKNIRFSANICVNTLLNPKFEFFLKELKEKYQIKDNTFCIEVTEQIELHFDHATKELLKKIHDMGYLLAIDDFSMGNTSLKYLESNQFDVVKLDGNLVQNLLLNNNSREIIGSIMYLSSSLNFTVLAEFVESESPKQALENIGCLYYQGYLFGKAVPYEEFCDITLV